MPEILLSKKKKSGDIFFVTGNETVKCLTTITTKLFHILHQILQLIWLPHNSSRMKQSYFLYCRCVQHTLKTDS